MENWVIFAIAGLFLSGLFNFGFKVITKRNYNTSLYSIICYGIASLIAFINYIFVSNTPVDTAEIYWIVGIALGNGLFFFLSTLSRVKSMENIDTTIFFPLYKTFFPIIITMVSYFFLKENLSFKEVIGIGFGIAVPLMLITKSENKIQKNLKLGLIMVIVTSILGSISAIFAKSVSLYNLNYDFYIVISFLILTIISTISYKLFDKNANKQYSTKGIYSIALILGIVQFFTFYAFIYSLEGNLAIAITINSFSILIPIILSVIFYKEEMTPKKAIVIALSIISVILFI